MPKKKRRTWEGNLNFNKEKTIMRTHKTEHEATLKEQREELREIEYNAYDESAFPGSKADREYQAAAKKLREFDSAHPEIIQAINEEKITRRDKELKERQDADNEAGSLIQKRVEKAKSQGKKVNAFGY